MTQGKAHGCARRFQLAPAVGELVAELITEGRTTINRAPFRLDRFGAPRVPTSSFVSSYLAP